MTERNPIPICLSHLHALTEADKERWLKQGEVQGLKQAALWVDDSRRTMQSDSPEYAWAGGARQFLWQLADEKLGVAPWSTDMWAAMRSNNPVMLGKRGTPLIAMGIRSGGCWRHAESLDELCFDPDVWQPLPKAAK
jgi:hypothetical protein